MAYHVATLGDLAATYGQVSHGIRRLSWKTRETHSIVVFEDIELFFPREHVEAALVRVFMDLLESQKQSGLVVATSRHPSRIHASIKALFTERIVLQIPTPEERLALFHSIAAPFALAQDVCLKSLNEQAHAFVAADLAHWCRSAEQAALQDQCQQVSSFHFESTLDRICPSHLDFTAEKPESVRWEDIGGLVQAKHALEESAVWVYKHADAYRRLGVRPSKGVLLHGPPGTGKTLLAKAVATESCANFLFVQSADLVKGHVGDSEKAVAKLFQTARRCSPCVIFMDELETLFGKRESSGDVGKKLITQFLVEMDALDHCDATVLVLGATNHPESIDSSLLRPGRLDRRVYVGPPSTEERLAILQVLQRRTHCGSLDLSSIAEKTQGSTGADLQQLMRKAGLLALKRHRLTGGPLCVEQQDITGALL
ncbi:P-loop containing nucleoside triphosphate hydrolase protein [Spinellus fusiger]|nr:P-loop containing nucleoside triphosphate hydrolase protein [Spinellus fusiger]